MSCCVLRHLHLPHTCPGCRCRGVQVSISWEVADRCRRRRLEQSYYSYDLLCLIFLISPRSFFAFNLFSFDACEGFVFLRGFGFTAAFRSSSTNLCIASSRFFSCVRNFLASMTSMPSFVTRFPAIDTNRFFTSSGKGAARTSNRSWTAVATLLTFCPPGPEARTNSSCSSRSSIFREGVISSMNKSIPERKTKPLSQRERGKG